MHATHPNEPGKWTRLEGSTSPVLWRRERSDPFPVTMFYVVAAGHQTEVIYGEAAARARFAELSPPAEKSSEPDA